jgi:hypothetical protein
MRQQRGSGDGCSAPPLSSGEERRAGADVMVSLKRRGCLVAQRRVGVAFIVRGDPAIEGGDQRQGAGPLVEPQAFFLSGSHEALGVSIALGMIVTGGGLMNRQAGAGFHEGERGGLTAMNAHHCHPGASGALRKLSVHGHVQGRQPPSCTSRGPPRWRPSQSPPP